ncbi:MAG: transposase [Clostridiales bacterium]|nr:transposase [Clostridiales bacterium]
MNLFQQILNAFHYKRHEDNQLVTGTINPIEFIKKLVRHIPEKHFKMVRYYGLYAHKHKHSDKIVKQIHKNHHGLQRMLASW